MKITRTYPQPDSPQPHIGPRERALAVYKYLNDTEPEEAAKHWLFPILVQAFEQEARRARNKAIADCKARLGIVSYTGEWPPEVEVPASMAELLTGISESAAPVSMQKFNGPETRNIQPPKGTLDQRDFTKDGL